MLNKGDKLRVNLRFPILYNANLEILELKPMNVWI